MFQNPRSQFFNVDTTSELSFGSENLGLLLTELWQRPANVSVSLALVEFTVRSIFELPGRQQHPLAPAPSYPLWPYVFA